MPNRFNKRQGKIVHSPDLQRDSHKTWHVIHGKGDGSEGIWLVFDRSHMGDILFAAFEEYGRKQRTLEKDVLLLREDAVPMADSLQLSPFPSNLENPIGAVIVTVDGDGRMLGTFEAVDVEYISDHGALPNLDLLGCFRKIAKEQGLPLKARQRHPLHPFVASIQSRFTPTPTLSRLIR